MGDELALSFHALREKNLEALKLMFSVIFPVEFQGQMYKDCIACQDITQLAYHNDILVGAITARRERQPNGRAKMYIAGIGVLAPYRGYGIGTKLLTKSLAAVAQDANVEEAYLHVQVGNDEAVKFYEKFGFEVRETIPGYYKRLHPPDAWILTKSLC